MNASVHPPRLTVAVDDVYDSDCLKSMDAFLSCPHAPVQVASFLIALLKSSRTTANLSVYETNDFYSIFSEMTTSDERERKVDLYPFPLALTDEQWVYEYTASTEWIPYFMYSNIRALTTSKHQSPIRFLVSPFCVETWMASSVAVLLLGSVTFLVPRLRRRNTSLPSIFNQFSWLALFFLFVLYTSNLKALLAQPKPLDPFTNLDDLADQMTRGKRRILLEEAHTRRWRILTDRNLTKSPELESIGRVIETKPGSLVIAENQTDTCRMLRENIDLVFFAYEDLARTLCGDLCLWHYRVIEYPVIMRAIPIVNMTSISTKMDVFLLATFSYKEVLLNRLYRPRCDHKTARSMASYIGLESLYGPLLLWLVGLVFGIFLFCIENLQANMCARKFQ